MLLNLTKKDAINNPRYIVPAAWDTIFKELFGTIKNIDILELLISVLLNISYDDIKGKIKFQSIKMNKTTIKSKKGEKDIVFTVNTNPKTLVGFEMNLKDLTPIKIIRNLYFLADTFVSSIETGDKYSKIPRTIQFNFNYSFAGKNDKDLISSYSFRNKKNNILTEIVEIVFINVAKMSDMWYDKSYETRRDISPLMFLLAAIIVENERSKFDELTKNKLLDKKIGKKIRKVVMEMQNEDNMTRWYDFEEEQKRIFESELDYAKNEAATIGMAQGMKQGMAQGMAQGKTIGSEQTRIEFILNMYHNNVNLDTIASCANSTVSDIKKIIETNDKGESSKIKTKM